MSTWSCYVDISSSTLTSFQLEEHKSGEVTWQCWLMSLHGVWQLQWCDSLYLDIFCFYELSMDPVPTRRTQLEASLPKIHLEGGLAFPIEWTTGRQNHICQSAIKRWDLQVTFFKTQTGVCHRMCSQCLVFIPRFTVNVQGIARTSRPSCLLVSWWSIVTVTLLS